MRKEGATNEKQSEEPVCERCQNLLIEIHARYSEHHPMLSPKALAIFRGKMFAYKSAVIRSQLESNTSDRPAK